MNGFISPSDSTGNACKQRSCSEACKWELYKNYAIRMSVACVAFLCRSFLNPIAFLILQPELEGFSCFIGFQRTVWSKFQNTFRSSTSVVGGNTVTLDVSVVEQTNL